MIMKQVEFLLEAYCLVEAALVEATPEALGPAVLLMVLEYCLISVGLVQQN